MRKSVLFLFIAMLTALLSGCIISATPGKDTQVVMSSGEGKIFTIKVLPTPRSYSWYLDGNLIEGATQSSYVCTLRGEDKSSHSLEVKAAQLLGKDVCKWNINYQGNKSQWSMFRHDRQHTGRSPYTGPQIPIEKWSFMAGGDVESSPAIGADRTIYFGCDDQKIYALDGKTGALKWTFPTEVYVLGSPAIGANNILYIGSRGWVYGLNALNGNPVWSVAFPAIFHSSPAIGSDGTIYIGSLTGKVFAIEGDTGNIRWVSQLEDSEIYSSPAIGTNNTLYIIAKYGRLTALDCTTGIVKWTSEEVVGGYLNSPAIGADGTVYVGGDAGYFYAFDGENGNKKWSYYDSNDAFNGSPTIGLDGTIYIDSGYGRVVALDGSNGNLKWITPITNSLIRSSSIIDADNTLYIGTYYGMLNALDGATGDSKWAFVTGGPIFSTPSIGADGTIYVAGGYRVYAIGK